MDVDGGGVRGGIEVDFFGRAVEIAGLGVPVLAFAFVHGEFYGVAVGAMEGGVFVEDALDPVVARGELVKIGGGVAQRVGGDDRVLAGGQGVDIGTEDLLGLGFFFEDLRARLGVFFCGDDHIDAAI